MPLGLPDSPQKLVFRYLVQAIRSDPTCSRLFRTIKAWEGKPTDAEPLTSGMAPAIRLTPLMGPDDWTYPEAFSGDLLVNCEILIVGYDVGDMLDLWWAVKRAIYPRDSGLKMASVQRLQGLGARNGLAMFALNAADGAPEDNTQFAVGQIKISILEQLTT